MFDQALQQRKENTEHLEPEISEQRNSNPEQSYPNLEQSNPNPEQRNANPKQSNPNPEQGYPNPEKSFPIPNPEPKSSLALHLGKDQNSGGEGNEKTKILRDLIEVT